jgi:hypothetical protein
VGQYNLPTYLGMTCVWLGEKQFIYMFSVTQSPLLRHSLLLLLLQTDNLTTQTSNHELTCYDGSQSDVQFGSLRDAGGTALVMFAKNSELRVG